MLGFRESAKRLDPESKFKTIKPGLLKTDSLTSDYIVCFPYSTVATISSPGGSQKFANICVLRYVHFFRLKKKCVSKDVVL